MIMSNCTPHRVKYFIRADAVSWWSYFGFKGVSIHRAIGVDFCVAGEQKSLISTAVITCVYDTLLAGGKFLFFLNCHKANEINTKDAKMMYL